MFCSTSSAANNFQTIINGKNSELPYQVQDDQGRAKLTVTKHDEFFTHVNLYNGLDIECDSYNKLCIIKVQDRFRGRTNGDTRPATCTVRWASTDRVFILRPTGSQRRRALHRPLATERVASGQFRRLPASLGAGRQVRQQQELGASHRNPRFAPCIRRLQTALQGTSQVFSAWLCLLLLTL